MKNNTHKSINNKTIGVLVSGGDCSGLNLTVRSIVRHAIKTYNWRVIGIQKGYWGIWTRPMQTVDLTIEKCDYRWVTSGGIFLGSNKNIGPPKFADFGKTFPDLNDAFCQGYKALGLDAIIVIGGDGSLRKLAEIHNYQKQKSPDSPLNFLAIPKTIDNDVAYTDLAIGHETALDVVINAIDNLQSTAESHDRVIVVEVMGKDVGHIALKGGIAASADAILIPEIPYDINKLAEHINKIFRKEKQYAIVVVSESIRTPEGKAMKKTIGAKEQERYNGIGAELALILKEKVSAEIRSVSLGHIQRGGTPHIKDRLLAARFGVHAVDLIAKNQFCRVLCVLNGRSGDISIADATSRIQAVDPQGEMVHIARSLGIYVGEL